MPDERPNFGDRLRAAFLKPPDPNRLPADVEPLTEDELRDAVRTANDKERAIGALAAPLAAAIAFLVFAAAIRDNPAHYLANKAVNPKYTSPGLYVGVLLVLLVLSMLMLGFAMWRKRLFLGITAGLYAVSLLDFKYWGFAVPYAFVAGWLLVRHYRYTRDLKLVTSGESPAVGGGRPGASKRYTPPRRK